MSLPVSAVVPTLNEAENISTCLEALRAAGVAEIVVVDGGSTDDTLERAVALSDATLRQDGGLVAQLNRGARECSHPYLLFQYADGVFPLEGASALIAALERGATGGAFRLAFDSDRRAFRTIARGAAWRNRLGFGPFGDQSIFASAAAFEEIGGFDAEACLPDFDLVKRLKRAGRFELLEEAVVSSVRRWEKDGVLATTWTHWRVSLEYLLGRGRCSRKTKGTTEELRRVR
ncbi:MAG: glycosyltransferase family 2 protein [Planctomycetota bacterium]